MLTPPSDAWLRLFPGPRIPDVLAYVSGTWLWLRTTYGGVVGFERGEPELTDSLCEALNQFDRRAAASMDCDFQAETRELRRNGDGTTSYVGRADIRVILGMPGTPHLVLEFKKLNGTTDARRLYCFDGLSRFVEGKYGVGHAHGVMCGFAPMDLDAEAQALAEYIADQERARRLACVASPAGEIVRRPSATDPAVAQFDTVHQRTGHSEERDIVVLHVLLPCAVAAPGTTPGPSYD